MLFYSPLTLCRIVVPETAGFQERLDHLDYRVREFFDYLDNNKGALLDHSKRYRVGKPISTAMDRCSIAAARPYDISQGR